MMHLSATFFAALLATLLPVPAWAQEANYPGKLIRLIIGFGPGSNSDVVGREIAINLGDAIGQSVTVDNRSGAGGSIGTDAVAKASPDGYTIGLGTSSQLVMNIGLYRNLPFDIERDIVNIGLISKTPGVLAVSAKAPASLKELIAAAKANPGKLTYGSGGPGSISHAMAEAFAKEAGISLTHVPYRGNGPALIDLAAGNIDIVFDGLLTTAALVAQNRIRVLALSGAPNARFPQVRTFAELGMPNYDGYTWNNLIAPAGTPGPVLEKLNAALNKAIVTAGFRERTASAGGELLGPSTLAEADAFAKRERARWVPFIRAMDIKAD
ncbi:MAG: tripartite tricarboxylate transporter substrate binding protein [Betaproteobacteria bacterium]|nr:tripartite tricarboxylate transporter substrate binding protein [Betaproteobacteria bacterium]